MAYQEMWRIIGILGSLSGDAVAHLEMLWLIRRFGGLSEYQVTYQEMWWIVGILGDLPIWGCGGLSEYQEM